MTCRDHEPVAMEVRPAVVRSLGRLDQAGVPADTDGRTVQLTEADSATGRVAFLAAADTRPGAEPAP